MKSWTCFIVGNSLVVAVLLIEIITLDVCFDGFDSFDGYSDDRFQNRAELDDEEAIDIDQAELLVSNMVMVALIAGLSLEVISAVILSSTYGVPLDAMSAYKIPAHDRRYCLAGFIARFVAPITWGLICVCMGAASYLYNSYTPCGGGPDMSERTRYAFLVVFGLMMAIFGGVLVLVSLLMGCFACGFEPCCFSCCCRSGRSCMHRRVLAVAWLFDLWWQLAGVMWAYRTGNFGLNNTILLLAVNVLGDMMSEFGSCPPPDV